MQVLIANAKTSVFILLALEPYVHYKNGTLMGLDKQIAFSENVPLL